MPTPPAAAAGGLASALHLTPPGAAQCAQQRPSIRHGKSGGGGRRGGGGRNQFNYVDTETVNINTFSSPSHADMIPAKMESGRGSPAQAGHVCGAEWGGSGAAVGHTGPLGHTLRHNQAPHHLALAHGAGQGAGARDTAEMRPMVTTIHQQESRHETTVKTPACSQLEMSTESSQCPEKTPTRSSSLFVQKHGKYIGTLV